MLSAFPARSLARAAAWGFGLSLLSALPAAAHGPADGGLVNGFLHPLQGADHLLLLLGVGTLAGALDASLLGFALAGALLGSLLGAAGTMIPGAEPLAAVAVGLPGLLLLLGLRGRAIPARRLGDTLVGTAVALHALLHGLEAPGTASWWLGAGLAAAAVTGTGFLLGRSLGPASMRRMGVALITAAGVLALLATA